MHTCCDIATNMYNTQPTLCTEHTAAQIQAVQSLSSIIYSIQDMITLCHVNHSNNYHHPNTHYHSTTCIVKGTTPCSCLYKNRDVDKTQHVEPAQLLELIVLHIQIATCCRSHHPNTHIESHKRFLKRNLVDVVMAQ